jgi:hypothetical protein
MRIWNGLEFVESAKALFEHAGGCEEMGFGVLDWPILHER